MRFKTSLKLADDKVFGIELDLSQMPVIYIHSDTIEQINILDSFYEVREVLYRHGGKTEIILHCKNPKINGVYNEFVLLEYRPYDIPLVKFSLKTNQLPNNNDISFDLFKIPQFKNEYIEKNECVYKVEWSHLKDDNISEGVSVNWYKLNDFYNLNKYPYCTIP